MSLKFFSGETKKKQGFVLKFLSSQLAFPVGMNCKLDKNAECYDPRMWCKDLSSFWSLGAFFFASVFTLVSLSKVLFLISSLFDFSMFEAVVQLRCSCSHV